MKQTIEAGIDRGGTVRLPEPVRLGGPKRALVSILDEGPNDSALLREAALGEDWNRPEPYPFS